MIVKKLIKDLQDNYNPYDTIAISLWGISDVYEAAELNDYDKEITEEQAKEVIEWVENHQDANDGINWDVVWMGIQETIIRDEEKT